MSFMRLRKLLLPILLALALTACGTAAAPREPAVMADLSLYPASDMSGFAALANHEGELAYRDVSVADVDKMMSEGESFVLLCAYPGCPWCELLVEPLNAAAERAGVQVAFINTRRDPSWKSNLDMEDYDLFVELFGEYLDEDEQGRPHLYVPDVYVVRNGEVAGRRDGVLAGLEDPATPMTDEQRATLDSELDALLDALG